MLSLGRDDRALDRVERRARKTPRERPTGRGKMACPAHHQPPDAPPPPKRPPPPLKPPPPPPNPPPNPPRPPQYPPPEVQRPGPPTMPAAVRMNATKPTPSARNKIPLTA